MPNTVCNEWFLAEPGTVIWSGHSWGMSVVLIRGRKLKNDPEGGLELLRMEVNKMIYQKAILYAMLHPQGRMFHGMRLVYGHLPNPSVSIVQTPDPTLSATLDDGSDPFPERTRLRKVRKEIDPDAGYGLLTNTKCEAKDIEVRLIVPLMVQILAWAKEMRALIGTLQRIDAPETDYDWSDHEFEHLNLEEDEKEKESNESGTSDHRKPD